MPVHMKRVHRVFTQLMGRKLPLELVLDWIPSVLQDASSVFGSVTGDAVDAWI